MGGKRPPSSRLQGMKPSTVEVKKNKSNVMTKTRPKPTPAGGAKRRNKAATEKQPVGKKFVKKL